MKPKFGLFALGLLLLLLPLVVRVLNEQPLVLGNDAYGHLRIAEHIVRAGIPDSDPAMPERPYTLTLFDALLTLAVQVVGSAGAILLPFLLGLGTLMCLFGVIVRSRLSSDVALGAQLAFILSPLFVDSFSQATPRALELFLLSLLFFVLLSASRRAWWSIAAVAIASGLATMGLIPALAAILLPLLLRTVDRRVPQTVLMASLAAFIVLVAVAVPTFLQTETPSFARPVPVAQAISDFGGDGLSLFAWLLAGIGLIVRWHVKKKYYAVMIASSAVLIAALVLPSALVIAHVLVALFAGYALAFFATMHWSFDDIRVLTMLVLVCGLLFSTLAHGMALAQGMPNQEMREAAQALQALPRDSRVVTHPEDGFWVAYWSGKRVVLDGWLRATPQVNERWALEQAIWHAQDITRLQPILHKHHIGALVITRTMREGSVWDMPEQDVLYLLRNNETFKNAYHSYSVDSWTISS